MAAIVHIGGSTPGEVLEDTWGHLKARPDVRHPGVIVFAEAEFGGEVVILCANFGPDAGCGPWFCEHVHEWLRAQDTEPGRIYTFSGWYRTRQSGDHEFCGEIASVALTAAGFAVLDTPDTEGPKP